MHKRGSSEQSGCVSCLFSYYVSGTHSDCKDLKTMNSNIKRNHAFGVCEILAPHFSHNVFYHFVLTYYHC